MEKTNNGWMIATIILGVLLLIETMTVGLVIKVSFDEIGVEMDCAYDVCELEDQYYYDFYSGVCYCYKEGFDEPYKTMNMDES